MSANPGIEPSPVNSEAYVTDPHSVIARLRAEDPIHFVPGLPFWLATRYDDVRALFTDPNVTNDPRAWQCGDCIAQRAPGRAGVAFDLEGLDAVDRILGQARDAVRAARAGREHQGLAVVGRGTLARHRERKHNCGCGAMRQAHAGNGYHAVQSRALRTAVRNQTPASPQCPPTAFSARKLSGSGCT